MIVAAGPNQLKLYDHPEADMALAITSLERAD
jgi:hypothetical protein